jgi:hypothetical protein
MQGLRAWMRRFHGWSAVLLVVCVLAPYAGMLAGRRLPIPDDVFVSDLADGEFAMRVEAGRLLRAGQWPVWTPNISTGMPVQVDPISLLLFAALPPALALGWLIGLGLAAAAVGTYLLSRQYGASRAGACLSGFAFAWSGFLVCQMRHLGVLGVVAWFPLALYCLERAATGSLVDADAAREIPLRRRLGWLCAFAGLYGLQCLAGFPQSVYIASLVYGALVLVRLVWLAVPGRREIGVRARFRPVLGLGGAALVAVGVGALIGMVTLLPLRELGSLSDRSQGGTFAWATQYNYWPRSFLSFFVPYANGDISNLTFRGTSIFWEDFGYVGLLTMLLAVLTVAVWRRRFAVAFWTLAGIVAYGLVLGREAPFYAVAYRVLPGLQAFRFPTRFLFVVELALALLGGLGVRIVQDALARRFRNGWRGFPVAGIVGCFLAAVVAADLVWHNRRQNPFVDACAWLSTPRSAAIIRQDGSGGRVFTPGSAQLHTTAFQTASGWSGDLSPYLRHREFLQPDSNLLHGLPTLDGYAGIAPRWTVDLLGDHNRGGIIGRMYGFDKDGFCYFPAFYDWLEALNVRWVILPLRLHSSTRVTHAGSAAPAEVYRLPNTLPRARVVAQVRSVEGVGALWRLVQEGGADLRREVVLMDPEDVRLAAAATRPTGATATGEARIVAESSTEVVIETRGTQAGDLLLLSDAFYPGWRATVDRQPVRILRANVAHRAVILPAGCEHRVRFVFQPRSLVRGAVLTGIGVLLLLGMGWWAARRSV